MSDTERWQGIVFVGPSLIDGQALFAARGFAPGEVILRRDESREVTHQHPLDPKQGEHEYHCDWLDNGRVILLPFPERHLNHSCDDNAYVQFLQGVGHITARRTIEAGDEITNHYCLNEASDGQWQCNCGSPACLKAVPTSFFCLPIDRQRDFLPLLADWFIEENRDRYEELKRRL